MQVLEQPNCDSRKLTLKGLSDEMNYGVEGTDEVYAGDLMMNAGMLIARGQGVFNGNLIQLMAEYSGYTERIRKMHWRKAALLDKWLDSN